MLIYYYCYCDCVRFFRGWDESGEEELSWVEQKQQSEKWHGRTMCMNVPANVKWIQFHTLFCLFVRSFWGFFSVILRRFIILGHFCCFRNVVLFGLLCLVTFYFHVLCFVFNFFHVLGYFCPFFVCVHFSCILVFMFFFFVWIFSPVFVYSVCPLLILSFLFVDFYFDGVFFYILGFLSFFLFVLFLLCVHFCHHGDNMMTLCCLPPFISLFLRFLSSELSRPLIPS